MNKIGIVSFRYEAKELNPSMDASKDYRTGGWANIESYAKKFNNKRLKQLIEIRNHAKKNNVTHIVFPGKTLAINFSIWKDDLIANYVTKIAKLFSEHSIIFEAQFVSENNEQYHPPIDTGIICLEKGKEVGERIQQLFASSVGTSENPLSYQRLLHSRLLSESLWGHRIKKIDGVRFFIWVCGEINFLISHRDKMISPSFDFNSMFFDFVKEKYKFDIFFNPAHTPWGRSGLLKDKLKYLSNRKRIAIHTTNMPTFQKRTERAIYIFKNDNEGKYTSKEDWHQNKSWIMEIIEV